MSNYSLRQRGILMEPPDVRPARRKPAISLDEMTVDDFIAARREGRAVRLTEATAKEAVSWRRYSVDELTAVVDYLSKRIALRGALDEYLSSLSADGMERTLMTLQAEIERRKGEAAQEKPPAESYQAAREALETFRRDMKGGQS